MKFCSPHCANSRRGRKRFPPLAERLWAKVKITPSCWIWTGYQMAGGYGSIKVDGVDKRVHRVAYELLVGAIPEGLTIDYLCRNRQCVNPDHLEPVTMRENALRGIGPSAQHAQRTRCPQGHPYSGRNNKGARICDICKKAARERYVLRQKHALEGGV